MAKTTQRDDGGTTGGEPGAGGSGGAPDDKPPRDEKPPQDAGPDYPGPLTDRAVAVTFAALAVLAVLGYLFVNKLSDMSREDDCMLAHRKNCAGDSVPLER